MDNWIIIVIIAVVFVAVSVVIAIIYANSRKALRKKIEKIKKKYPHAYDDYKSGMDYKEQRNLLFLNKDTLKKIISRPNSVWKEEERVSIEKNQRLRKEVENIKNAYPHAYESYLALNADLAKRYPALAKQIIINPDKNADLERITSRLSSVWESEEAELIKTEELCNQIAKEFPKGYKRWNRLHLNSSNGQIIESKDIIADYEVREYKSDEEEIERVLQENKIECFYHFTTAENYQSIKKFGGLYSERKLKAENIPHLTGGDPRSLYTDKFYGFDDFISLSFCKDHPMGAVLKNKNYSIQYVLLMISPEVATWKDTEFTDKNATSSEFNYGKSVDDLKRVNFDVVKMDYLVLWNHYSDKIRKLHQAEVKVKTFIPLKYILDAQRL